TRMRIENFGAHGVPVEVIVAAGGLPERNKLLMQIYADVTGRPIHLMGTSQGGAFGSAMHAAVAAGSQTGGYDSIFEAAQHMAYLRQEAFTPLPAHQTIYDQLYRE